MQFDEPTLAQVVSDVCSTMLELPITSGGQNLVLEDPLVAAVQITGEWQATVEVATTRPVVRIIAARMFALPQESLETADLHDALGEVANMIGGNLKGIANHELDLSLPSVSECESVVDTTARTITVSMKCQGRPVRIRLIEMSNAAIA